MPQFNNRSYTGFPGLNIRAANGVIRFETPTYTPITLSGERMLYTNSSNQLIWNDGSNTTILSGAGGGGYVTPSLDSIYAGDKSLAVNAGTLTFAGGMSDATNVITLTNIAGSSGAGLQITNSTTSNKDINGTSSTWYVLGTGAATFLSETISGTAASTIFTITTGDAVFSDSSLAITDADNAATFTVTNSTATTASAIVLVGAGAFTGSTTSSFFTITNAGLTTGTSLYLAAAAITTGKMIDLAPGTTQTSGAVLTITSAATGITNTTGALAYFNHTGNAGVSAVLVGVASAAVDETTLVKVTASAALALGNCIVVSASAMTTGKGIGMTDLDSLTTGIGLHIASAATAIATTGRLLYVNHTGATGTSAILSEFKTAATDETIVVKITTAAMVNGVALNIVGTTGMTTGSLIQATSSTAGAVATNGIFSFSATGIFTSTSNCGFVNITANSTTAGTVLAVNATGLVDGIGIYSPSAEAGLTTGKYMSLGGVFTVAKFGATVIAGSASGTAALTLTAGDIVVTSGNVVVTAGGITSASPTGAGIGYATGAGGTVTQLTNRSTGVTLNTLCGKIQTDTTSLAAGASAEFTLTNSTIAIGDVVVVSQRSGSSTVAGVAGTLVVEVVTVAAGSCIISLNNNSSTTAETGAVIINFAIIKAVTA